MLKLEGRVTGPWVAELEQAWRSLSASLGSKRIKVDLCGVLYMNEGGRKILAEIHNTTGADLIADSPMTKYFAEEAQRASRGKTQEEF
jgi:hypothetical protein